jgi:hypothetical protein
VGDKEGSHDLAIRTSAAVLAGGASLLGPDAAAVATALTPAMEAVFSLVAQSIGQRRFRNAAETVTDASEAAGEPVEELLEEAVSDDRRHELLARALGIAQDTALRDKRRALGRALAAGIKGDDARIDDELLFIRAVADVDVPHIKLLTVLREDHPGRQSGSVFGWSLGTIGARHPEFGGTLPALIWTLESHGLIQALRSSGPYQSSTGVYSITAAGRQLLERLADRKCWMSPGGGLTTR